MSWMEGVQSQCVCRQTQMPILQRHAPPWQADVCEGWFCRTSIQYPAPYFLISVGEFGEDLCACNNYNIENRNVDARVLCTKGHYNDTTRTSMTSWCARDMSVSLFVWLNCDTMSCPNVYLRTTRHHNIFQDNNHSYSRFDIGQLISNNAANKPSENMNNNTLSERRAFEGGVYACYWRGT